MARPITINEACEIAGVTRRTIHTWLNQGKIRYVRTAGGQVRIFADSLFREVEPPPATVPDVAPRAPAPADNVSQRIICQQCGTMWSQIPTERMTCPACRSANIFGNSP